MTEFEKRLLQEINKFKKVVAQIEVVVNSFVLFKKYDIGDYERAMRKINEILEGVDLKR